MILPAQRKVTAIDVAPGPLVDLWIGTNDGLVEHLGRAGARTLQVFDDGPIEHLALAADATSFIASGPAGRVAVHAVKDGASLDAFACPAPVAQAAQTGPRRYVTVDRSRRGSVWEVDAAGALAPSPILAGAVPCPFDAFAVRPGGGQLTLLSGMTWMTWDRLTNRVTSQHTPVDGMWLTYLAGAVGLSQDGAHAFVYWDDHAVFEADTGTQVVEQPLHAHAACGSLAPGGQRLALGGEKGELWVVDAAGKVLVDLRVGTVMLREVVLRDDRVGWRDRDGRAGLVELPSGRELIAGDQALDLVRHRRF